MRINFKDNSNKLYNFLSFPIIIYFEGKSALNYKNIDCADFIKDSIDNLNSIKLELEPYDKEIRKFFNGDFFNHISLFDFIYKEIPIVQFENREDLFQALKDLSDIELRDIVTKMLISYDKFNNPSGKKDFNLVLGNDRDSIDFIKNLDFDLDFKWNLTMFINDPKVYVEEYIQLMNNLYPIFEKYYLIYEDSILETGNNIKELIDRNGLSKLSSLFNQTISEDVFNDTNSINLFISFIFSESIMLSDYIRYLDENNSKNTDLVVGINTIKAMKLIKKEQEDKKLNRINIFKALGDETRYEVLMKIAQGVSPNKEIARQLGISGATVSYHIASFVENGLLSVQRIDSKLAYVINYEILDQAIDGLKKDINIEKDYS